MATRDAGVSIALRGSAWRRWWSIGGAGIGVLALAWVLWRIDFQRLEQVLASARTPILLIVPLALAAEQLVRAWKWRQVLYIIRPIGTFRLFGAIMAGYFANMLVPLGISPLVRSWLIARLEALRMSTVLATAAIDRLVDGLVFAGFVALALGLAAFPDPTGDIRRGLILGGAGSLVLFALLLWMLGRYKRGAGRVGSWSARLCDRLPARWSGSLISAGQSFAQGIVWPREAWRGASVVLASIAIKVIAMTHFLWAGLAVGVVLRPADYVFLLVFLGFLIILTRIARIPGGFFFGAIFALDLLGIGEEPALAMALVVQLSTMLTVGGIGAVALWRHGIALDALLRVKGGADDSP